MTAKVARLRACWRVDLKMSFSFSRNLRTQVGELDTLGTGRGGYIRPGPKEEDHAMGMEYISYQPCGLRTSTLLLGR